MAKATFRGCMTVQSLEVRTPTMHMRVVDLQIAIERELGLSPAPVAPAQLALPNAPASIPERSALRVRRKSTPAREPSRAAGATPAQRELALPCGRCARRGYHLVACPDHPRNRRTA